MHILLIVINNHILTFKQFGESCPIIVCIFLQGEETGVSWLILRDTPFFLLYLE